MKHIFFLIITFIASTNYAAADYSGIWKDTQGTLYSIHQSNDSIVMGELLSNPTVVSPAIQGSFYQTKNELDLAIAGYGFFILKSDDGTYSYTRDGHFHLSSDNAIVSDRGERLVTENQLNVPYTAVGSDKTSKSVVKTLLKYSDFLGPPPAIVEARKIIVTSDGFIGLYNSETGEVFKFDRIQLAFIPFEQIKFSGYPIKLKDQKSVSVFYPGNISQNESADYNASIQQEALEELSYELKTWRGYYGNISDNNAKLMLDADSNYGNSKSPAKEIIFDSNSTATVKSECFGVKIFCDSIVELQDKQLTKVY